MTIMTIDHQQSEIHKKSRQAIAGIFYESKVKVTEKTRNLTYKQFTCILINKFEESEVFNNYLPSEEKMVNRFGVIFVFLLTLSFLMPTHSTAADTWAYLSVKDALNSSLAKDKLDPSLSFYMKGQKHGKTRNASREYTANKRARKFGRSAEQACENAFISALLAFQDRASREGRNAVIDLYSVTKNKDYVDREKYSCLVGGMMTNVALRGKVADIK
ncbi:MAG: hypothetical protein C0623_00140 [Desulfuromonas sp.]|nr:MAG: hypothetical protein C0623_00140 [Desulfuromonas sp.]